MNYFGKFDAKVSDALGQHPGGHLFSETVHASHVPSDALVVPDAQLLFGGEFKRTGVDLVLSGDGREFVLHDYFKGEKHAPLASPDGAHLTGDLVNALAGQVQYAQAGGIAGAGQVIGHVTKLAGTATAIRNGVSIILNNGDNVEKGDVVASGSDSTVGITFIDGTVFGLSSNARMVLNEMVYDPNGSNNSSLLSLVAGTITFVAGETAKHGDMKVDTPVATMGIRGTAVLVEIDFSVPGTTPDAKFQVLVEPDGSTGSYILFDKTTLTPLAVVDKAGMQINVSNGVMSQTLAPLSPEIQKLITDVFSLKFSDSTNTKAIEHFTDSIVPNAFGPVQFALANGNIVTFSAPPPPPAAAAAPAPSGATTGHIPQAPNFSGDQTGKIAEALHVTNSAAFDTATGQFKYFDINTSDHDTVSVKFSSFTYQNGTGQDVTSSLNSLQLADILKVEAAITVSENTGPNANGNGTANWTYSVADKAFDFLAAGETLTLTYTATVDNNYQPLDQTGTQTITITVTGTNDAPVITSPQQNVSFVSAGTDSRGGELIPNTATHGTLNFADPDLTDTHTVAVQMASALLNGQPLANTVGQAVIDELSAALTASISSSGGIDSTGTGAGTIEWTLANLQVYLADLVPDGESLVLTYAVTVTDSQGSTSVQDVVVTIGGNNHEAVVWTNTTAIPAGGVALWSTASNWEGDRAPSILGTDDVIIGTDQLLPATPVFPATVNDAEAAKSLTMDYFTDFGTSIPELDVLSTGSLTIVDTLKMDTSTDSGSPLTAESIIKNFGTISVGGIAELLKHSVLDNYGTITLAKGGVFADQSSITNSGTIEIVGGTLDVQVGIDNFVTTTVDETTVTTLGTVQVDGGATLKLSDGAAITKGEVTLGSLSVLDVEKGAVSLPAGMPDATLDGVSVTGTGGLTPSTIEIGVLGAATLLLDDGTSIKDGNLTIGGGSALDVTTSGATLDGVNVTGTNGPSGGAGAMLGGIEAHAGVLVSASTIEVGTTTTTGTVLTLDDGTTITDGNLIIDSGNTLEIEKGAATLASGVPDAALDDVNVTNLGTIQVDPSATLTLNGATIDGGTIDDAGTISVAASSEIDNATVNGGGDLTVTSGTLTLSEVTLDDVTLSGSFTNADTLTIDNTVTLNGATIDGGMIDDAGILSVIASSEIDNATVNGGGDLTVTAGTLTLSGVTLDNVTLSGSFANADTLTIDNTVTLNGATIDGGTIDDTGTLSVIASSTIENATVSGDITVDSGKTLTLNTVTLAGVTLSGGADNATAVTVSADSTIENATVAGDITVDSGKTLTLNTVTLNGATLSGGTDKVTAVTIGANSTIQNAIVSNGVITVDSGVTLTLDTVTLNGTSFADTTTGGTILVGSGTTLNFNGATIDGGTLNIQGELDSTGTSTISGATIINQNLISIVSGTLTIDPTPMSNTGTIEVHSGAGLVLDDDAVTNSGSSGDGTIQVDQNATLTLQDSSITGGVIKNFGTIDLAGDSSFSGLSSFINEGTLDAEGTLTLTGMTINNTGHILKSSGTGVIDLVNTTINGGTLGGKIETVSPNKSSTLNGLILAFGTLVTAAVGVLELTGTIFNNGEVDATTGVVDLENATIKGGTFGGNGTIATASGNSDSVLSGVTIASGSTVTAAVGTLDLTGITTNNGEIDATTGTLHLHNATVVGGTLGGTGTIATDSFNQFSTLKNVTIATGTKVSASAGTLELTGTINNHGEIDATTGAIDLSNVTIVGGTLGGDGTIVTVSAFNTFNGVTIASGTTVEVADGTVLDLVGNITDAGTIALEASGHVTGLQISGNVSLTGGGDVTMSSGFSSFIASDGSAAKLSNFDTISGAGTIGDSHLTLSNSGTIDATGSHALVIDTGTNFLTSGGLVGNLLVTNNVGGVLEASAGHTLLIDDNVANSGLIQSGTSGSHSGAYVDVTGNITGTGSIEIFNNSTIEIGGTVSSGQTVTFGSAGAAGTLILDDSHDFHGTIVGLVEFSTESQENHVDLKDLAFRSGHMSSHFNASTDTVTVSNGLDSVTLHLSGGPFDPSFELAKDSTGGTLIDDPSASSGTVTIDSGKTLDISAASSATVTFTNTSGTTGELVLDDSKDFTGTIAGFAGDGTTANSDLIDVTDVNIADVALNKTTYADHGNGTGTLTLYNASGQALDSINFDGNYQLANFTIESDGNGGTLIVDPPVNTSSPPPANTTVASNQNSTGTAGTDGFVFNFDGHHHVPTTDFHPDENFQPGGPMLTNLHTGSNGAPDLGHANVPVGSDGQDNVGLSAFAKAHLHAADFHFV